MMFVAYAALKCCNCSMKTPEQFSARRSKVAAKARPLPPTNIPAATKATHATAAHVVSKTKGQHVNNSRTAREDLLTQIWHLIGDISTFEGEKKSRSVKVFGCSQSKSGGSVAITNPLAHKLVMRGISPKTIAPLSDVLGVGVGNVTSCLDIDRGTPARQESKGQFLPRHAAEGVLRLLDIEGMAFDTFEEGDSTQWLSRPHPMLDGETPLQAAGTSYGAEQVKSILVAIKYGGAV